MMGYVILCSLLGVASCGLGLLGTVDAPGHTVDGIACVQAGWQAFGPGLSLQTQVYSVESEQAIRTCSADVHEPSDKLEFGLNFRRAELKSSPYGIKFELFDEHMHN